MTNQLNITIHLLLYFVNASCYIFWIKMTTREESITCVDKGRDVEYPALGQQYWCMHCGMSTPYPLPIEPLYFIDDMYRFIPFPSKQAMLRFMHRRKEEFPKRYMKVYRVGRQGPRYRRVITASEVRRLRDLRVGIYDKRPSRRCAPQDDECLKYPEEETYKRGERDAEPKE